MQKSFHAPDALNKEFQELFKDQAHLVSETKFFVACMEAFVRARRRGETVLAPVRFISIPEE
jgi:hypothetical protein